MKKRLIILILLLPCAIIMAADKSIEQAMNEAQQFWAQRHSTARKAPIGKADLRLAATFKECYAFNRGTNNGFVLIAKTETDQSVLGYSDIGSFETENMPEYISAWLNRYAVSSHHDAEPVSYYTPIQPLVQTQWGQGAPYNNQCPKFGNQRTVAGCVPIAFAQLMKYYQYPQHGKGSHSYTWEGQNLSADFEHTTYLWNQMQDSYRYAPADADVDAVSTLVSHCGIACEIRYGTGGSSANTTKMARALCSYFDYDSAMQMLSLDYMPRSMFLDSIHHYLTLAQPLIMHGTSLSGGHCFICDGMDEYGRVHINWGWNGMNDGYYRVSYLDPTDQGIGGSPTDEAYTQDVGIFAIRPNQHNTPFSIIQVDSTNISCSKSNVQFSGTHFKNASAFDWEGYVYMILIRNEDTIAIPCSQNNALSLPSLYYYYNISLKFNTMDLSIGTYQGYWATSMVGQNTFSPIYKAGIGPMQFTLTIDRNWVLQYTPILPPEEDPEKIVTILRHDDHPYKEVIATYYPTRSYKDMHAWLINIRTGATVQPNEEKARLRYQIVSASPSSFLGTYLFSINTFAIGTANRSDISTCPYGQNTYYVQGGNDGELTVIRNKDNTYTFFMDYFLNGFVYCDTITLPDNKISAIDSTGTKIILDNQPLTTLSIAQINKKEPIYEADAESAIPYLIEGVISNLSITSDKINLTITDGEHHINGVQLNGLDNSPVRSTLPFAEGDTVIVLGKLKKNNALQIQDGYIYSYRKTTTPISDIISIPAEIRINKILYNNHLMIYQKGQYYDLLGRKTRHNK